MASPTVGLKKLELFQIGPESTAGTLVPATKVWNGPAYVVPEDAPFNPEHPTGIPQPIIENTGIADTGTTIVLGDTDFSVEQFGYLLIASIKAVAASAGTTPFLLDNFALPTSATIETIKTLSAEWYDGVQGFAAAYGFIEKWSVHADVDSNNGRVMMNAVMRARKMAAQAPTASLSQIANQQPINFNPANFKIDALGTAAGTASALTNTIVAFNIDAAPGFILDRSGSGRTDKDFSQAIFNGDPKVTGKFVVKANSSAYTHLANARSGTGIVVQLQLVGTGTRSQKFNLPLFFTKVSEVGRADRKGLHTLDLEWKAGYSNTSTAQGISFPLNMSASTTMN